MRHVPDPARRLAPGWLAAMGLRGALLGSLLLGSVAPGWAQTTPAPADGWRTGTALLGTVKYPPGFAHFDTVNPAAPKGGTVRLAATGSFDSFNPVPAKGVLAAGMALGGGYVYQTLMASSEDEPYSQYGLLAEAVRYPADFSSATYRLDARARWADGQPVTPEDVVFSLDALKASNPQQAFYYRDVVRAQKTGPREVTFTFARAGNRELPQIVGQLTVLPEHWWKAKRPDGTPRDVTATTLEPPMGSGPYRMKGFEAGRSVTYERVGDWWGAALPVNVGRYNFDTIRTDYYLDPDVMREAFKADAFDFQVENRARNWKTAYDIPAVRDGRLLRQEFPSTASGVMQGFAFNLRRPQFADERVRRAFNLAFDFETLNRTLFYGLYTRTASYFAGLDLASSGLPQGQELALLQGLKDKLPASVFTTPYANPVGGSEEADRANLREAARLLREAGWTIKGGRLVNASGEPMAPELLLDSPALEPIALAWAASLKRLGIALAVRTVDSAQFASRQRSRDFDLIVFLQGESQSPGNEQREYWGSAAADRPGSANIMGIKDAGIDALTDAVIYAKDRDGLVAATHALDRVLLAGTYLVPHFRSATIRTLHWDRFGQPATLPSQSLVGGFPDDWWWDPARAARTGRAGQ